MFNRALTSLDLSNNNIGGVSGYVKKGQLQGTSFKKGDAVQYNGQQCTVFMEEDRDGDLKVQNISGIVALAEALKVNRALKSVDLRNNSIPDEAIQQLRAAAAGKSITLKL